MPADANGHVLCAFCRRAGASTEAANGQRQQPTGFRGAGAFRGASQIPRSAFRGASQSL
jgi:hypothetical protein